MAVLGLSRDPEGLGIMGKVEAHGPWADGSFDAAILPEIAHGFNRIALVFDWLSNGLPKQSLVPELNAQVGDSACIVCRIISFRWFRIANIMIPHDLINIIAYRVCDFPCTACERSRRISSRLLLYGEPGLAFDEIS